MQFRLPDDEHNSARNMYSHEIKLIVKQKFCASSWLITEINKYTCVIWQGTNHELPEDDTVLSKHVGRL